jgi:type III secretion system low calcium response chaperone LcrH/SycD
MSNPPDTEDAAIQQWLELFHGGATLGSLTGMQAEHYEMLYAQAYRLYSAERFADAEKVFSFLSIRNPYDTRFSFGLAACLQAQGEWSRAMGVYGCMVALDIENPAPPFHICECMVALGQTTEAMDLLEDLTQRISLPEHADLKNRSHALLALLKLQQENTSP